MNWEEHWKRNKASFGVDTTTTPTDKTEIAVTGLHPTYKYWIIGTGLVALAADLLSIHDSVSKKKR